MSNINTVNLLNQLRAMTAEAQGQATPIGGDNHQFNAVFQQALSQVSGLQNNADGLKTQYELGDPNVSIGQVMVEGQKATVAFEATVRVRNKLVQAYQDIMNMPL